MSNSTLKAGLTRLARKAYKTVHTDAIAALHKNPSDPVAFFFLGVIASDHGNYVKALELFARSERLDPKSAHYPAYLAQTHSILRGSLAAKACADRAAQHVFSDAHLSDMIGVVYSRCGYHDLAIPHFRTATELNPNVGNYAFNLAASEQFLGHFDEAKQAYRAAIKLDADNYRAWSSLISLDKQTPETQALDALLPLFERVKSHSEARLHIGHALAKTYEDLGQHEDSLDWLLKAKSEKRRELPFKRDEARELFALAKNTDTAKKAETFPQDTIPVFIVGLPRTGTTLVDRILSSHPDVVSAGELSVFADLIKEATQTPSNLVLDAPTFKAAQALDLSKIGAEYLARTADFANNSKYMIDKMPLNFFYAALIAKAFPKVKIIALRRGAMDSCLSNFRQLFSTQFSYYNYTFDLENTGLFYSEFDALMRHWRETLPSERFLEVRYEDIVFDQETQTRAVLDFCGLDWDEACLRFHENTAPVSTASSVQVRQPLYSGSIGRWKKYGTALDGLKAALGDLADS